MPVDRSPDAAACRGRSFVPRLAAAVVSGSLCCQVTWFESTGIPASNTGHRLAYDSARARTVLFGGAAGTFIADTWEWDGSLWVQRVTAIAPPWSSSHALAYDLARSRTVLFGGIPSYSSTWEYGSLAPGVYEPFGNGCAGSAGTPQLAAGDDLRPYPGVTCTLRLTNAPANAPVFFAFGLSASAWGALALPLPLDNLGMIGCTAFASVDTAQLLVATNGTATLALAIPPAASLVGLDFYNQCLVLDPPANAAGATASNAARGRVGAM